MLSPDDIARQSRLAELVSNPHAWPILAVDGLDERYTDRIIVYRDSFIGRTVSSLSDAVLHQASQIFGEECVKEVVARYFSLRPPEASCIVRALDGLPAYIVDIGEGSWTMLLASVVEVCLARWHMLAGPDPGGGPSSLKSGVLAGPAALITPRGSFDLYRLFEQTETGLFKSTVQEDGGRVDLLLVKSKADEIAFVPVPAGLLPLAAALCAGADIATAIRGCSEEQCSQFSKNDLRDFLTLLVSNGAMA